MFTNARLKYFLFLALLLFSFTGFAQKADSADFFSNFYKDTLFIKARFMECGEWGGHVELIKFFLNNDNFFLAYNKFKVDCSKVKENNDTPLQILEQTVEKRLTNNDKQLIKQYACSLVAAKFREPDPMNAGYVFEMKNTTETLNIHVYTWGRITKDEYLSFISKLLN